MAEKPDPSTPVRPNLPPISDTASAHAPFLYFEEASTFGHMNGIIQVTLEALRMYSSAPGANVEAERVLVAHLRMNIAAARALRAAIDGALLLAAPPESGAKN